MIFLALDLLGHPQAVKKGQYVDYKQKDAEETNPVVANAVVLVALQAVHVAFYFLSIHHHRILQRILSFNTSFSLLILLLLAGIDHYLLHRLLAPWRFRCQPDGPFLFTIHFIKALACQQLKSCLIGTGHEQRKYRNNNSKPSH